MDEIRVKVLLTNSLDEALNRREKLRKSAVRRYEADAMVDTGTVRSVIPTHVMQALGVMSRGNRISRTVAQASRGPGGCSGRTGRHDHRLAARQGGLFGLDVLDGEVPGQGPRGFPRLRCDWLPAMVH
jgi:hypothetical protein